MRPYNVLILFGSTHCLPWLHWCCSHLKCSSCGASRAQGALIGEETLLSSAAAFVLLSGYCTGKSFMNWAPRSSGLCSNATSVLQGSPYSSETEQRCRASRSRSSISWLVSSGRAVPPGFWLSSCNVLIALNRSSG